jgi:hypothetical protein
MDKERTPKLAPPVGPRHRFQTWDLQKCGMRKLSQAHPVVACDSRSMCGHSDQDTYTSPWERLSHGPGMSLHPQSTYRTPWINPKFPSCPSAEGGPRLEGEQSQGPEGVSQSLRPHHTLQWTSPCLSPAYPNS